MNKSGKQGRIFERCPRILPPTQTRDRDPKKISQYDQEIPQSQTTDKPMAPRGRATQQLRDTRKKNYEKQPYLSLPHQDDCKTRMDINGSNNQQQIINDRTIILERTAA